MHERNFYNDVLRRFENAKIMGVLNITPDSFSDGGINYDFSDAVNSAREMVNYNVDILDVGGESTRPGARPVPIEEELHRVIPLINILAKKFPQAEISVDTYKSEVARQALISGAKLVNDISGGTFSPDMFDTVARYNAKIVIMHIKGTPRTMQKNPEYDDVVAEIGQFLGKQAERAISAGIPRENIIIDPGIGFGKKYEHNITILNNLDKFKALGYKVLIGTSRKSFIGYYTGEESPARRDPASYITFLWSIAMGADIIRVHDVVGTVQTLRMAKALLADKIK